MNTLKRAMLICAAALWSWAPAALAYNFYPENGFLGYTDNKWGDPALGTGATVYWSLMPVGTAGSAYCGSACTGTSTLTLPNFYDTTTHTFRSVNLTDADILGYIRNALRAWGAVAGVTFVYVASDSGVPINDPAAEPPATGQIRIGVFDLGGSGSAGVGYAPPPNGFEPNSPQLATGAGDILMNGNVGYAYQNPAGADGTPLDAFPQGGGLFLNDFTGLILHEIGHALGLDHSSVSTAVMCGYPYSCTYDSPSTYVINRHPTADDTAGMQTLYGPAVDSDHDGVPDAIDNCTLAPNGNLIPDAGGHSQLDADGDGYGNICDADLNNSALTTTSDYTILRNRLNTSDPVADLNGSGLVTTSDYTILRNRLNTAPGPSGLHQ